MEEETNDTNNMKITIEEEDDDLEDDTNQMKGQKKKKVYSKNAFFRTKQEARCKCKKCGLAYLVPSMEMEI